MHKWVTVGILSLQANLSLAADLPSPVTHSDFPDTEFSTILLGRDLFFDPLLSGNKNIACATCHHSSLGAADNVALSIGEGGVGLGQYRLPDPNTPPTAHIPRNAPALFNLGAPEFTTMFHDGRVMRVSSARFGFKMPEGRRLERPVPSALAAQALLPILSHDEMAGTDGDNDIATAVAAGRILGLDGAWQMIATRIENTPDYRRRFSPIIGADEPIHITDIATAIAAFVTYEFTTIDSPFDAYLRGRKTALTPPQKRGLDLFYGDANCAACHSGPYQTDHNFHAIGIPQIGPGKTDSADTGRAAVTKDPEDRYRFRTPTLRNVALTAPYGHSGAYPTLADILRHHMDPLNSLVNYDPTLAMITDLATGDKIAPPQPGEEERQRIAAAIELAPQTRTEQDIADLVAFLDSLTDPVAITGRLGAPGYVPSGLPVDRLGAN